MVRVWQWHESIDGSLTEHASPLSSFETSAGRADVAVFDPLGHQARRSELLFNYGTGFVP